MKALELNFKQKKNDEPEAITRISSHRYRDNMRYDWSGREEFSVTMAGFNGNAWTLYLKDYWTDGYKSWKKIDEIRKRDLEKNLYKWFVLDWHVNPPYWDRTFINYFERDWNYSEKFMGKGRSNDGSETLYLYGKTKYADHWLLLEPHTESGNNYIFPINVSHYSNGWLLQPSSWKMQVDWWRVDD